MTIEKLSPYTGPVGIVEKLNEIIDLLNVENFNLRGQVRDWRNAKEQEEGRRIEVSRCCEQLAKENKELRTIIEIEQLLKPKSNVTYSPARLEKIFNEILINFKVNGVSLDQSREKLMELWEWR